MVALVFAVTEGLYRHRAFDSVDRIYYDAWHRIVGVRHDPSHVLLVIIDDETLGQRQGEPLAFYGPHFARALSKLRQAGAAIVGFDLLFLVSAEAWLRKIGASGVETGRFDAPFRAELHRGDVVLAGIIDDNGRPRLPLIDYRAVLPAFPDAVVDIGLVNVIVAEDGVTRDFAMTPYPATQADEASRLLNFAPLLAIRASGYDPAAAAWRFDGVERQSSPSPHRIGFSGPPGTIPRMSLASLLEKESIDDQLREKVAGRVVIIGLDHAADQDIHATPYSGTLPFSRGREMNGAELHANIVETLLANTDPRPSAAAARMGMFAFILLVGAVSFRRLQPLPGAATGLALALLAASLGYLAFVFGIDLAVGQTQAGLGLAFLATLALRLTEEERQRTELRRLFGRYVSDDIVNELLERDHRPDLGGEESVATVLFSDIRNFSKYSEALGPRQTLGMLNAHWSRVCEPILEQGGTIYSFAGDEVFAVFGVPIAHPDHAARAVRAALQMQQITREYRERSRGELEAGGLPPFAIGIGLNTGTVLAGSMGFSRRTTYTAIGETTNTASRLESLNKRLGWDVIASAATVQAAGPNLVVGARDVVEVAGRSEPVEVYEVLDFRP